MLKNLLVLADGTEISSGVGTVNAIQSTKLTQSVNTGEELALGSTCAAILEMTLFTPGGNLQLTAGDRVILYKESEDGIRTKVGVFILEQPIRPSANTVSITGYDPVIKLDKDLTLWLNSLTGWPYRLMDFAKMVCQACGLQLVTTQIPNGDFFVSQFTLNEVTGRQLMQWIGEASCRFCRANAQGDIELAWYEDSGKVITPSGELRYYGKGLAYETYQVSPVEAVQIKLADSNDGALWPAAWEGANAYVIAGNPIFLTQVTEQVQSCLQVIEEILKQVSYTPCQVSIPVNLTLGAGSIVDVLDANGRLITAYVMTKVSSGQRDALECTGSPRRDSSAVTNNKPASQKVRQMEIALRSIDGKKVVSMINLSDDGIKIKADKVDIEGKVNADYINALNVTAAKLLVKDSSGATLFSAGNNKVQLAGWNADSNSLYSGRSFSTAECFICTGSAGSMSIGGSEKISGWVLKAGGSFGVTKTGDCYLNAVHISGGSMRMKIPAMDNEAVVKSWYLDGTHAVIDTNGMGMSNVNWDRYSGSAVRMDTDSIFFESGKTRSTTPLMHFADTGQYDGNDEPIIDKTLIGQWYIGSLGSAVQVTSDRNAKFEILPQANVYSQLFDKLRPVTFKYKNGTSGRIHTGFIAQDVEDAVLSLGLTTQEFAGVCYDVGKDGNKSKYGIRYEEIVSMNTYEIQKLKQRVAELEKKLSAKEEIA